MSRSILIRGARQLLTLQGPPGPRRGAALRELGIIADGAVLIRNGYIDEVGPSRRVEALQQARDADEIEASGKVVMPGFVDSHTHLVGGPFRASEGTGGRDPEAFWKPVQHTSRHTMESQGMHALEDFARHGTTLLEATSGFGIYELGEIKILRAQVALNRRTDMLVSSFMGTRWPPRDSSTDAYIDWMCSDMLPIIKRRRLAEFADISCEQDVFSPDQAQRYFKAATGLGFTTKMHAGRTSSVGAVMEAVRLGAAGVSHAAFVSDAEVDALAASETIATLLPGPVFFTGTGRYPGARQMIDRGAAIALGTGYNPETCPSQSMQLIIALSCRMMHLTVAEAISAATINGAHALRRGARTGSLQPDKAADLVILDVSDYRELADRAGVNMVETTMKGGRLIWHRGGVRWPV